MTMKKINLYPFEADSTFSFTIPTLIPIVLLTFKKP